MSKFKYNNHVAYDESESPYIGILEFNSIVSK